jgi:hypothetical protein
MRSNLLRGLSTTQLEVPIHQYEVLTERARIKRLTMKRRKREYLAARAA